MREKHKSWMACYARVYTDDAEKERRFNIFKDNVKFIESFNKAGNRPYKLAINEFADQTNEEFQSSRNSFRRATSKSISLENEGPLFRYENASAVPTAMDW